ncbi:glycolate oxidase subunit GlcE [Psychromarinibacter sp. C21-152]|uniref:Glycolate oxidase subunit GlcE n=1 Tax=Psychromarinibacter sediminicola TaxID=3033385 RepID=A0AAE3NVX7_9RHOB|nr:glycolate oxidase subunit GlcE [Psychromarinibacter sediminicola]MDF0603117.1 glycolate oxidase subunit GlcE [Psychromarinibacter sediminicola]
MAPTTEADLAAAVASADGPLRVLGGGTRPVGRPVAGTPLSAAALSGVELYEPGALTLVVRAGTPLAEVEDVLAAENQRLPFEPMDHRALLGTEGTPTIGGVVAANVSGPRRVQAGACRDFLLGVRFVDGTGTVVKNGGRVMKNVTGYDLVKLMAGSWGTLGVLTEVSLKVLAGPEAEATLVARGLNDAEAVAALCRALGTPFDVSGAAHLGDGVADGPRTQVRVEGMASSVVYRVERLLAELPGFVAVEGAESAKLWREVRDVTPFAGEAGAVWRVSVKPTDGPALTAALRAAGLAHRALYDWGGGLVWLLVPEDGDAGAGAVRDAVAARGGHATLVRASEAVRAEVPVFQPEPGPLAAIGAGLRARFDPRGILNPGLMA